MHSISAGSAQGTPIVCMPGYAAGAAFFYRNLAGLSKHARVHLVDWLGTGLSGRPAFRCHTREETEDWFVDSLERWRIAQGHSKMILVGHSLGGYLSTTYALKYPDRVAHLVLVNPAGMVRTFEATPRVCGSAAWAPWSVPVSGAVDAPSGMHSQYAHAYIRTLCTNYITEM